VRALLDEAGARYVDSPMLLLSQDEILYGVRSLSLLKRKINHSLPSYYLAFEVVRERCILHERVDGTSLVTSQAG
jgi:hypothetical protein